MKDKKKLLFSHGKEESLQVTSRESEAPGESNLKERRFSQQPKPFLVHERVSVYTTKDHIYINTKSAPSFTPQPTFPLPDEGDSKQPPISFFSRMRQYRAQAVLAVVLAVAWSASGKPLPVSEPEENALNEVSEDSLLVLVPTLPLDDHERSGQDLKREVGAGVFLFLGQMPSEVSLN